MSLDPDVLRRQMISKLILGILVGILTAMTSQPAISVSENAAEPVAEALRPTLNDIKDDEEVQAYIRQANKNLGAAGYTEHGFRHVGLVANIARNVLRLLGHSARDPELAAIAYYLHDIGNVISRSGHSVSGALLAKPILERHEMPPSEMVHVLGAIGAHDSDAAGGTAEPVSAISAALMLADKTDV